MTPSFNSPKVSAPSKRRSRTNSKTRQLNVYIFLAFVLLVSIFGGSSRYDTAQLLALRPLCCVFLIIGLYQLKLADLKSFKLPLAVLLGLTTLMALQLVPLPPGIWTALPGREVIFNMSSAIQELDIWRPVSLAPSKTWNALAGMIVPLCTLLLLMICRKLTARTVMMVIVALGLINASLGMLQILAPTDVLYFYQITNEGSPVGLFANTNHSATFAAISLTIIAYLMMEENLQKSEVPGGNIDIYRVILACLFLLVFMVLIVNRSRAGLLAASIAIIYVSAVLATRVIASRNAQASPSTLKGRNLLFAGGFALVGLLMIIVLLFSGQSEAMNRLLANDSVGELRTDILPTLVDMIRTYFPFGSGFGSFENVYYIHEKPEFLRPTYLNQAHNDVLQFLIEGGLVAAVLFAAGAFWVARTLLSIYRNTGDINKSLFWIAIFLILGSASAADYPLRTPLMQLVAICLIWVMSAHARPVDDEPTGKGFANRRADG